MIFSVTGTRFGFAVPQAATARNWLTRLTLPEKFFLEHGACIGVDEDFVVLFRELFGDRVEIHARPGKSAKGPDTHAHQSQKALTFSNVIHPVETHFARNRRLACCCDVTLAGPYTMEEQNYGGTWYTIGQARKNGKRVVIFWPDGSVVEEDRS